MSLLTRNLIANFAGQGWLALLNLAAVPLYVYLMGIEAYGLVGFYTTLQVILPLFDFGITPTMNRAMARYSVQSDKADEARDFVRTVETGYWLIGLMVGALLIIAAPWVASGWIKPTEIPVAFVQQAVMAMGVLVILQFPFNLYQGALLGLQQQVLLNVLIIGMATLRVGGVLIILAFISPTITAFFVWHIVVNAWQTILSSLIVWRSLPSASRAPRFVFDLIRQEWRFAIGVGGIVASAMIFSQLDKIVLSNLLSLEMYGYYVLATIVAGTPALIVQPVANTIFPRFSALVKSGDESSLRYLYHFTAQLLAVLVSGVVGTISLFSYEIILLWTRDSATAQNVASVLRVMVVGMGLNWLMTLPYLLQLASGWTRLPLLLNSLLAVLMLPLLMFLVPRYGPVGAAVSWTALNIAYVFLDVPLTHRHLLRGAARRWLWNDTAIPMLVACSVVALCRIWAVGELTYLEIVFVLCLALIASVIAGGLSAEQLRVRAWRMLVKSITC